MELPEPAAQAFLALRLDEQQAPPAEADWPRLLDYLDRQQLTLVFGRACEGLLPDLVAAAIGERRAKHRARQSRMRAEYDGIAESLRQVGVGFIVLKGLAHDSDFFRYSQERVFYDLDLMIKKPTIDRASTAIQELGFEFAAGQEKFPTDHLPPLVRKTGWEWRGDYFDPEIPPVVELHHRLWDAATEGLEVAGLDRFWARRVAGDVPCFAACDRLTYAALHALRHLLRGSLKAFHIFELASILNDRAHDQTFWGEWGRSCPPETLNLCVIPFATARSWFGCATSLEVSDRIDALPSRVSAWLNHFGHAPAAAPLRPNKDELWLHLELIGDASTGSRSIRRRMLRRRLLPTRLPGAVSGAFQPRGKSTWRMRIRGIARQVGHLVSRTGHHVRTLGGAGWSYLRWRLLRDATAQNEKTA